MPLRVLAAFLLCIGVLGLAACGGDDESSSDTTTAAATTTEATTTEATTTEATTTEATTTEGETTVAAGDAAAGKTVFTSTGCGTCHTLAAAGTTGTVGPNLDEQLVESADSNGEDLADFTRESIEDPDAVVADGFQAGLMPSNYSDQLDEQQLDDLVAFIVQSVQ
jgi:mono/diheme cytochrome c family protein